MALYPNHKPRGVRKDWDHCSLGQSGGGAVLRNYGVPDGWGDPVDAVGWFDMDSGAARLIVADYANQHRATLRFGRREYVLTTQALAAAAPTSEPSP